MPRDDFAGQRIGFCEVMELSGRTWTGLAAALGLMLLILDAKTALNGALEGLELCLMTIVPSLLPFFLLSILLTGVLAGRRIPFLTPIEKICGMPAGSGSLLLVGLLGGYPAGAQAVAQAYSSGQISRSDALRLLGFCSNAGPSFLFGIVAMKFDSAWIAWVLWGIHILSAISAGILLPGKSERKASLIPAKMQTVPSALDRAIKITASVCAWVILFRVIIAFLDRWFLWLFPVDLQVVLGGVLELANGCCILDMVQKAGLRFVVCAAILGLGGMCVAMQTASVTEGLGIGWYFPGKLLQCAISVFLAAILQLLLFPQEQRWEYAVPLLLISAMIVVFFAVALRKMQKKGSNPQLVGV